MHWAGQSGKPRPPTRPADLPQKPKRENSADPGCVDGPGFSSIASVLWHPCLSPSLFGRPAGTASGSVPPHARRGPAHRREDRQASGATEALTRLRKSGNVGLDDAVSHRSRFGPGAELRGLVCRRGRGGPTYRRLVLQGRLFHCPGGGLLCGRPSGGRIFVRGERNQDGCLRVRRACGHYTKQQDERGNEPHAAQTGLHLEVNFLSTDSKQKCKARSSTDRKLWNPDKYEVSVCSRP